MDIEDILFQELPKSDDKRGAFMKWFDTSLWNNFNIKQVNIVDNPAKGTIRGFHAQSEELAEGKLVTCLRGKILDVVFDIRENSKTYGTTNSFILDMNKPSCLFVPRGCLHAYQVLEDCTLVGYLSDNMYVPDSEYGIRYDDPIIAAPWRDLPVIISDKDRQLPFLENL